MIKFFFIIIFLILILIKNKIIIFYYNIYYLIRFIIIFLYIFKDNIWSNISFYFRIRYYSIILIILRVWILRLIIICLDRINISKIIVFISLILILIFFFSSIDLILFYFSFEVRLIPTFFLILFWGRNPERVRASYYLLIYILLFSFPLLVYIIDIYIYRMTLKFRLILIIIEYYVFNFWTFMIVYIAFFIKIPIYLFHIWLPKAHVEAPVYGSMILAGILLKIGRYGLLRLIEIFIRRIKYRYIIFRIRIIGRLLVRIICLVQVDIKRLVAYSSVVHINIILCSLLTICKLGALRSYIIIVSHGLCSSGLFYIVNLYYKRTFRRLLFLNKGILRLLPSISLWWFLLCVINFSFPFSINFFREVIILGVIVNWEVSMIFYLILICFFRRAYSLYLFSYIQHGKSFIENKFFRGLIKENIVLIIHIYPLIILLLNMILFS